MCIRTACVSSTLTLIVLDVMSGLAFCVHKNLTPTTQKGFPRKLLSTTAESVAVNKQIHVVDKHFILIIHQYTTNYFHIIDVVLSIRDLYEMKISDRNRNFNDVRIIGFVLMNF